MSYVDPAPHLLEAKYMVTMHTYQLKSQFCTLSMQTQHKNVNSNAA